MKHGEVGFNSPHRVFVQTIEHLIVVRRVVMKRQCRAFCCFGPIGCLVRPLAKVFRREIDGTLDPLWRRRSANVTQRTFAKMVAG